MEKSASQSSSWLQHATAGVSRRARERRQACYVDWSFEELRGLAKQLQLVNASSKSRRELLDLLVDDRSRGKFQNLENCRSVKLSDSR